MGKLMEKENKPLSEKQNYTTEEGLNCDGYIFTSDVKQAVKEAYEDVIGLVDYTQPCNNWNGINDEIKRVFKDKFGFD